MDILHSSFVSKITADIPHPFVETEAAKFTNHMRNAGTQFLSTT